MNNYISERLQSVDIDRAKSSPTAKLPTKELELSTNNIVKCCRTTLPEGVSWKDVFERQVCRMDGTVVEPWLDTKKASAESLHRPLSEYGKNPHSGSLFDTESPRNRPRNT